MELEENGSKDGYAVYSQITHQQICDSPYFFDGKASGNDGFLNLVSGIRESGGESYTRGAVEALNADGTGSGTFSIVDVGSANEDVLLLGSKTQYTTDDTGVYIDTTAVTTTRVDATSVKLTLLEAFGVIGEDEAQQFDHIEWYMAGTSSSGSLLVSSGSSYVSDGDTLFTAVTGSDNVTLYSYTMGGADNAISTGNYGTITVQLYKSDESSASYTISSRLYELT